MRVCETALVSSHESANNTPTREGLVFLWRIALAFDMKRGVFSGQRGRGNRNAIQPRLPASLASQSPRSDDDGHTDSRRRLGAKKKAVSRKEKRKALKEDKKKAHVRLFQDIRLKKLRAKREVEKAEKAATAPAPAADPMASHALFNTLSPSLK